MRESKNIRMVKKVARAMGDMCEDVLFVGGAVVELYATDPASPPVRPTVDVDCVVQVTSREAFRRIEKGLEERGFRHDTSEGAPVCRWLCDELQVDVMPTNEEILGFANHWHAAGMAHTIQHVMEEGTEYSFYRLPSLRPPSWKPCAAAAGATDGANRTSRMWSLSWTIALSCHPR